MSDLARQLLAELEKAHAIISNGQNICIPDQLTAWRWLNKLSHTEGAQLNRMSERSTLIAAAKEQLRPKPGSILFTNDP